MCKEGMGLDHVGRCSDCKESFKGQPNWNALFILGRALITSCNRHVHATLSVSRVPRRRVRDHVLE